MNPPVTGFPAVAPVWRDIAGHRFQKLTGGTLVTTPAPSRPQVTLWLRRVDEALWAAKVVVGSRPIAEYRGHSARLAVEAAEDDGAWWDEPAPEIKGAGTTPDLYPANYSHSPAGWYADRPTAHDSRWDR